MHRLPSITSLKGTPTEPAMSLLDRVKDSVPNSLLSICKPNDLILNYNQFEQFLPPG